MQLISYFQENPIYKYPLTSYGVSNEATTVSSNLKDIKRDFYYLPFSLDNNLRKFNNLSATWKNETRFISSISEIVLNPSYQEIVGMGDKAIHFILEDLKINGPSLWFSALKAITGSDPVSPSERGDVEAMSRKWISWGEYYGYI